MCNKVKALHTYYFFEKLLDIMQKEGIDSLIDGSHTYWHIDDVKMVLESKRICTELGLLVKEKATIE